MQFGRSVGCWPIIQPTGDNLPGSGPGRHLSSKSGAVSLYNQYFFSLKYRKNCECCPVLLLNTKIVMNSGFQMVRTVISVANVKRLWVAESGIVFLIVFLAPSLSLSF